MLTGLLPYAGAPRTNMQIQLTNSATNKVPNTTITPIAGADTSGRPFTQDDYMKFSGSNFIRFSDRTEFHTTAPFSIELEFFVESGDGKWIATNGEGFGAGWPEWSIITSNGGLVFNSSSNNNGNTTTATFMTTCNPKQWYRVGFMFYTDAQGAYRVRGYVNDIQVFDVASAEPYNTPNGIAFGSDYAKYPSRGFIGRIRNVWMGKSLFWTV